MPRYIGVFTNEDESEPQVRSVEAKDLQDARSKLGESYIDDYGLDDDDQLQGHLSVFCIDQNTGVLAGDGVYQHSLLCED